MDRDDQARIWSAIGIFGSILVILVLFAIALAQG